jgi:hypothetical protein
MPEWLPTADKKNAALPLLLLIKKCVSVFVLPFLQVFSNLASNVVKLSALHDNKGIVRF